MGVATRRLGGIISAFQQALTKQSRWVPSTSMMGGDQAPSIIKDFLRFLQKTQWKFKVVGVASWIFYVFCKNTIEITGSHNIECSLCLRAHPDGHHFSPWANFNQALEMVSTHEYDGTRNHRAPIVLYCMGEFVPRAFLQPGTYNRRVWTRARCSDIPTTSNLYRGFVKNVKNPGHYSNNLEFSSCFCKKRKKSLIIPEMSPETQWKFNVVRTSQPFTYNHRAWIRARSSDIPTTSNFYCVFVKNVKNPRRYSHNLEVSSRFCKNAKK